AGVLVPAFVQVFLGSVRQARPQEGRNRVDDRLEPSRFLAELFESIAQFGAFAILGQLDHVRSLHDGVRATLAISNLKSQTHAFWALPVIALPVIRIHLSG